MTVPRTSPDRLYELLPALHRIADAENGGELRALLALINEQADDVRADLRQLWDDFFIETSQHWVIPYIGDLVGNVPLHDLDVSAAAATAEALFADLEGPDLAVVSPIRLRADVAKTIYYRRRKGTPPMLEELARDVTGWDARVVEFFQLLDWNQHLEHLRLDCHGCPDLRRVDTGDRVGGPWDTTTHTVDVRAINEWDGWYGIANIGFFLWRLRAAPRTAVVPRRIGGSSWRFTFSPLGQDVPIFSAGDGSPTGSGRATELTVDSPIRPAAFFTDLKALPATPPAVDSSGFYGPDGAARLVVFADNLAVPASDILCLNLDGWTAFAQPTGTRIGIDVARGRLALPTGRAGQTLRVTFCEGVSTDLGGGEYPRHKWLPAEPPSVDVAGGGNALEVAIAGRAAAPVTIFRVTDGLSYTLSADISLAAGEALTIEAADQQRPHIRLANGSIGIQTAGPGASLTLNGLLVEGGLRIEKDLGQLRILHSTLVPGRSVEQEAAPLTGPSLVVAPGPVNARINTLLEVQVAFSIVGALRIPSHISRLWLLDSVVDGIEAAGAAKGVAVADATNASGPPAHIERSTILGTARFFDLEMASELIFSGIVQVDRRQVGCVRFSYVAPGSATPQQYRCQPTLEVAEESERRIEATKQSGIPLPLGWQAALEADIERWLVPTFESDRYGHPAYVQLRRACPIQIRTGAEDGSEMGAYCLLKQPQREANLRLRLDEYLPIGLEAGLITVT